MSSDIKKLAGYAIATVSVAATTVLGIAILEGFKGAATGIDNTTVDLFINSRVNAPELEDRSSSFRNFHEHYNSVPSG